MAFFKKKKFKNVQTRYRSQKKTQSEIKRQNNMANTNDKEKKS